MNKSILILLLVSFFWSCKFDQNHKVEEASESENSEFVVTSVYPNSNHPLISVHRGGKGLRNYPENCLETIKYVHTKINAFYEIDIAKTLDNKLVLMHDNTLDRTTNGQGVLEKKTFEALQSYMLKDDFGNVTNFKIPLFREVLMWAKNNDVILTIDIKKSVAIKDVIDVIKETNSENIAVIITYDVATAKKVYAIAPELILSVSARNDQEWNWLLDSGIPTKNMIAFTGTRLSEPALYEKIHDKGVLCMLGSLGNLDKQAEARGDHLYQEWRAMGIDVLATDRPFEVAKALGVLK